MKRMKAVVSDVMLQSTATTSQGVYFCMPLPCTYHNLDFLTNMLEETKQC